MVEGGSRRRNEEEGGGRRRFKTGEGLVFYK